MFDNLLSSLKSEIGGQIMNQTRLPENKVDETFSVLGETTKEEVSKQMTGGGISGVMNLFSKQQNNSQADQLKSNISSGFISKLVSKVGLSQDMSGNIAGMAVPALINMITKKNSSTPDDDPSPLMDLFGGGKESVGSMGKNLIGKFMK